MRIGIGLGGVAGWALIALAMTSSGIAATAPQDRVTPIPLGGALTDQRGDRFYGVYIPTRYGGSLTITASEGSVEGLMGPDGRPRTNGGELGQDQHGWYTFAVKGAEGPYRVSSKFVQVGEAARRPWNFYYWPTKGDSIHEPWAGGNGRVDTTYVNGDDRLVATPGSYIAPGQDIVLPGANGLLETMPAEGDTATWFPNLYDDLTWRGPEGTLYQTPSPLLKYDQLFGSGARGWESANAQNQDINRWPGHCLGGAVASILLNEPIPAPGSGMTRDELKALWSELGENHLNHRIGDFATDIPGGPPRPGVDVTDRFAPQVHRMFEQHIRGRRQALLSNMRAFPPNGKENEVWNQGVGKVTTTYYAIPGKGERSVRLLVEAEANTGANLNEGDPKPRVVIYEYTLVYGLDGEIDQSKAYQSDWIAVRGDGMFAPLNVLELAESRWQGHNPYVTEANIRAVDLANGGGQVGRFAGAPPQFRPVGSYEAGRGPAFAGFGEGGMGIPGFQNNLPGAPAPRRGVLSRLFAR
ncbi:hypothetical protein [Tautonia plasticadhaerens]|uniref:Uncharacterized protein n=1 Tax=Tautonia plasticadhaerens TaxID=2527974 RepID=A0A518GW04_9BACT|nr:hypothetical protein [Tautonia plasticadhaerens]QDV32731.1 hypothetical protein ElP_05710 [Tautonia plasticadhaerens]